MSVPKHGGDTLSYSSLFEGELIDYSSNINPLGVPPKLKEGLFLRFDDIISYPDIKYRELKSNLSKYLGADESNIHVGNGAVEILDQVISKFKRLIIVVPSFLEYELRADVHNIEVVKINLDENLNIPLDVLKEEIRGGDLVLLTSPHNPSGKTLGKDMLLDLYMHVVSEDAYLLLDEAFHEFAELDYDSVELFSSLGYSNIGIVRAATKFFGIPGIRLGYGVFQRDMVNDLNAIELPWSVNSFAVAASSYIFDEEYIKKSKEFMKNERTRFANELSKIVGVQPYSSNSNFILLKLEHISENKIFFDLAKAGFLVRRCSNFENLHGTHIRIAIKTTELNDRLLEALKIVMEENDGEIL